MARPALVPGTRGGTQIKVAVTAAVVGVVYGYDIGNISGALVFLTREWRLSPAAQGSVTTVLVAGNIVGSAVAGRLAAAVGRKVTMVVLAAGYAVFAAASSMASGIVMLGAARFLLGVAIGLSLVVAPIFVAESAPTRHRGALTAAYQVATVAGILLAYLVDFALSGSGNWRIMLGASAVPALLVLALLIRLPDTARWYVTRGRLAEARAALRRADPDVDVDAEIARIRADIGAEGGGSLAAMFRAPYARATAFVLVLGFLVQITGINAITYYSPMIFHRMGYRGDATVIGLPAIVQAAALLATIAAVLVVDRLGRRPVLLGGIAVMTAACVAMTGVFSFGSLTGRGSVAGFGAIVAFTVGFNFGFGALVWVYASESFPTPLRSRGAALMLTTDLAANLIIAQMFPPAIDRIGGAATFAIFALLSALAWAFVFRYAPETRGRPLDDIREYWRNGARWPD